MKRADCVVDRACSWLAVHGGGLIIGLVVVWMAAAPPPAWSQSAWPSYPNNNAITITSGGNVGIGTTSPAARLDVYDNWSGTERFASFITRETAMTNSNGGVLGLILRSTGDMTDGFAAGLSFRVGDNTASPTTIAQITGTRWGADNSGALDLRTASAGSLTVKMRVTPDGKVGIGTTAPQYLLAVNGTIGAKEVIVTNTGWADYVFKPGYRLRKLDEVGAYIRQHGRLPGIPSEKEVQQKGIGLGEMQVKLLAKIEELTLHMIEMEQQNRALRERIGRLEAQASSVQ